MTNVIPFRQRQSQPLHYLMAETLIDPDTPLEEGDLVALQWIENGHPSLIFFQRWWGSTGRDKSGKFVKKGSPREQHSFDGLTYCPEDLVREGAIKFQILGRVLGARHVMDYFATPAKACCPRECEAIFASPKSQKKVK